MKPQRRSGPLLHDKNVKDGVSRGEVAAGEVHHEATEEIWPAVCVCMCVDSLRMAAACPAESPQAPDNICMC